MIVQQNRLNLLLGVLIALGLILVLPTSPPKVEGQGLPPISITPTSGPPGTTVNITRSDGGSLSNCTANGDPTGFTYQTFRTPPPGGMIATYIVPQNATGSIDFACELFVGPAPNPIFLGTFRVTAPPPVSPQPPQPPATYSATITPLNGPPGAIITIANPDPIRALSCTILGPDGAPLATVAVPTAGSTNYTIPANIGDNLQLPIVCNFTALTGETIDAQLFTFTIDNVCTPRLDWQFEYTVQSGETLFEIAQRLELDHNILCEANCDRIPVCSQIHRGNVLRIPTTPPPVTDGGASIDPNIAASGVSIAPLTLDLYDIFSSCPELVPSPEHLPAHHQLLGIAASTNPCDALVNNMVGVFVYSPLSDDALRFMLNTCPQAGSVLIGFLSSLAEWDLGLAQQIDSQITAQNVCEVAQAIATQQRLPIRIAGLVPHNGSSYARLQSSDADLKYIITACEPNVDSDRRDVVLGRIYDLSITADDLYRDPAKCGFIAQLMTVAPRGTTIAEQLLYDRLVTCDTSATYAAKQQTHQLFGAMVVSGVDMVAVMNDPDLCVTPVSVFFNHLPRIEVMSVNPDVLLQLRDCAPTSYALRSFRHADGQGISTYDLWRIASASDPCSAGSAFIRGGALPLRTLLDPNCTIRHDAFIQATVILRDGNTLFQIADNDSWQQRTRYISRPASRLCDPLDDLETVEDTRTNSNRETICVQANFALHNETDSPTIARMRLVSTDMSTNPPVRFAESAIVSQQFAPNVQQPDFTITALVSDRSGEAAVHLDVVSDFGGLTDRTARENQDAVVNIIDRRECLRAFGDPLPPPPPPLPSVSASIAPPTQAPVDTTPQPIEEPDVFEPQPDDNPTVMTAFVGTREDGTSEIYIGQGGTIRQFTAGDFTTKIFPAINELGSKIAFLEIDANNVVQLRVQPLEGPATVAPFVFEGYTIATDQLAWTPDDHLLMTLRDVTDDSVGIYEVDPASASGFLEPRLRIANASSPTVSHDGSVIAFERVSDGFAQIWTTTLIGFGEQRISEHPAGISCFEPDFGPQALYFLCEVDGVASLFRYDAQGTLVLFQSTGEGVISHPAAAPAPGYLGYDDGARIYLRRDNDTASIEALLAEDPSGSVKFSMLQWQPSYQVR